MPHPQMRDAIRNSERDGIPVAELAEAIRVALTSVPPAPVMFVTASTRLAHLARHFLPLGLLDWVLQRLALTYKGKGTA